MSTGTNKERIEQNNLKLEEIKNQVSNLPEYQDTSDADATIDDIRKDKTAYVNGIKITGTTPFAGVYDSVNNLPDNSYYYDTYAVVDPNKKDYPTKPGDYSDYSIFFFNGDTYLMQFNAIEQHKLYIEYNRYTWGRATYDPRVKIYYWKLNTANNTWDEYVPAGLDADSRGDMLVGTPMEQYIESTYQLFDLPDDSSDRPLLRDSLEKTLVLPELWHNNMGTWAIVLVNTSSGNRDASKLLTGYTMYAHNESIIGTMPNNGELTYTPSTTEQTIPSGYTSGGTIVGDSNLVANNIRLGTTIFGVEGNLEADKPNQTKTVTPAIQEQVVTPDTGYELASVTVEAVTSNIDNNIVAENIKKNISILGVTGTLESGAIDDYISQPTGTKLSLVQLIIRVPEIDASDITNMGYSFQNSRLKSVSLLNTNKVTTMDYAFKGCTDLETVSLSDTPNVTSMSSTFLECSNIKTISGLNTKNVTNMYATFKLCKKLEAIPSLDTGKVTNMTLTFNGCSNLKELPLLNTVNVTDMSSAFALCSSLTEIPSFNTLNVTSMSYGFASCTSLVTFPLLSSSRLTDMTNMLQNCPNLSNESLNNILAMCYNATKISSANKTLKYIGLTSEQATKCQSLSNYSSFTSAGWTTGY